MLCSFVLIGAMVSGCGITRRLVEAQPNAQPRESALEAVGTVEAYDRSSIWDVFGPSQGDQRVNVNRYIWAASLDVLNFLPVQSVDPFTGVIITGFGTPPGGGKAYRATIHVRDPALDARSLNVALYGRGGAVSPSTTRAVEDAILSRARQMRIGDRRL
jgi:hypothetical protein